MKRVSLRPGVCGLAVLLAWPAAALDAPKKVVDYSIHVSLDPKEKLVDGNETLRWTNPSDDRVEDLKFHLYWNAFRNNRSTFFKESGGRLRGDEADQEKGWGSIDVTSMTWDGKDLSKGFRFESPDDGNPEDRTVLSVALPRPVEPGETVELTIAWKAKVPKVFARAGYVRDFFFFGQWYPKIGVYEPAGTRRRARGSWNCHQYHANSEFYADWGDYRVEITVPEKFVVGSAGAQVAERKEGGRKTLTFEQKSIHDFAWTADPRYVVKEDLFDPSKDVPEEALTRAARTLGRSIAELRAGFRPVRLRFYMQPDHENQWVRYRDAQKWALAWFGLYAFPYPYAQVSEIDPPEDGMGAGGMEYQTIYTGGTLKWLGRWPLDKLRFPEMVTIHEFGHGYWYGLVASNEFEESWMDEGINSFTEYEMVTRKYGYMIEGPFGVGFTSLDGARAIHASPDFDPILTTSWGFSSGSSYGRNSYPRTGVTVEQLRRLMGEERFWRGFRKYAERWRFDHPTSEDFFEAMENAVAEPTVSRRAASGTEVGGAARLTYAPRAEQAGVADAPEGPPAFDVRRVRALINRTWKGTGFVDFQILSATSDRLEDFTGFDDAGKPVNFTPGDDEKAKKDQKKKAKEKRDKKDKDALRVSRVLVVRDGDIALPVDVVLTFENGQTWRTTWDGHDKWLRLTTTYRSRLVKAEIDPDRKVVLDRNPWNNARYLEGWKGPSAAGKVRAYTFHLLQILVSTFWSIV